MAFVRQRGKKDCGVAALAMLLDTPYEEVYRTIPWRRHGILHGTDTKMLRTAAERLGYEGRGTPKQQLKRITRPKFWADLPSPLIDDFWALIPDNSLVKVAGEKGLWHWVAWRKGRVYDPARGVFAPGKYGIKPSSYMEFIKETNDVGDDD